MEIISIIGLLLLGIVAGVISLIRNTKMWLFVSVGLVGMMNLWVLHYRKQLSLREGLTSNEEWHLTYMAWIQFFSMMIIFIGPIIGLMIHQKKYLKGYE
jgi:hypothetical protein